MNLSTKHSKTYVLAVSGGVDSVVMLHKMLGSGADLVVAHFEHGIRGEESQADAEFVKNLALKHKLKYEICHGGLGPKANEFMARKARYAFLREVAKSYKGTLCTAHHADDVIETVAINLLRKTSWRGLSVMNSPDIYRPLINQTKADILRYAKENKLEWREDSTNNSDRYVRNQVRAKLGKMQAPTKEMMYELFQNQIRLSFAIDKEITKWINEDGCYSRYFFIMVEDFIAIEILRSIVKEQFDYSITRPQAEKALLAIKTAKSGEVFELSNGIELVFDLKNFEIV